MVAIFGEGKKERKKERKKKIVGAADEEGSCQRAAPVG